ncbi:MAG: FlgD immunoglobulin-like domain containing protein [Calditrichia bacterium]
MKLKLLLFLVMLFPISPFSQDAASFFPHNEGDTWQYLHQEFGEGWYWTRTIVKDSLDADSSHQIFFTSSEHFYSKHFIIDTLKQLWNETGIPELGNFLDFKLDANPGEWYRCDTSATYYQNPFYKIVTDTGLAYFLGKLCKYKIYNSFQSLHPENYPEGALDLAQIILVDSLGWFSSRYDFGTDVMVAARINGVEYGKFVDIESTEEPVLPHSPELPAAYPNPFNSTIRIPVKLPFTAEVRLSIYNAVGQNITTLYSGKLPGGKHDFQWNGKDETGRPCATGIYFIHFEADHLISNQKIIMIK